MLYIHPRQHFDCCISKIDIIQNRVYYDYDLLIFIASWPERRSSQWKALLVARAIENQTYVVGVNRIGVD